MFSEQERELLQQSEHVVAARVDAARSGESGPSGACKTSLISTSLDRSAGSATFSSRRSSSGTVGRPLMSMRLVSTLRTWSTTPFGTALTFIVFGTMKMPSSAAPRCRASRSTRSSSFFGQMPR